MNKPTMLLAAAVLIAMTGCGRSSHNAQTTATGAPGGITTPAAAVPATGAAAGATPPDCNGQSPVWAIYRTKAYLLPGDPHYGRTKRGSYICLSQAQAEGYRHARGPHHHHRGVFSM